MAKRIELWPLDPLVPYARNTRTHSAAQVAQIAASIAEFGWANPILAGGDGVALDKIDVLATDALAILGGAPGRPQAEVAQGIEIVLLSDCRVHIIEDELVHLGHHLEWPLAVPDDIPVSEMKVGREPGISHGSLSWQLRASALRITRQGMLAARCARY
jgi:hypothetical protein